MMIRYAALSAGLLVAAAAQARAQAVQLRFTPPVGQVTRYRTVNQIWSSGDTTTAPALSTLYSTRTVMAMDGANYVVKTVMDSTLTVAPGGGGGRPAADPMRGMAITQHMDPRGHVLSSEMTPPPGLPPFVFNMLQKNSSSNNNRSTAVMPEGPISPGYTWTDSMVTAASAGRGRPAQVVFIVTYKLERVEQQGAARLAIVSMNGAEQGGLTGTVIGELALDVDAGRLAHMETNMTVQSQQGGNPVRMKMTMETLP